VKEFRKDSLIHFCGAIRRQSFLNLGSNENNCSPKYISSTKMQTAVAFILFFGSILYEK